MPCHCAADGSDFRHSRISGRGGRPGCARLARRLPACGEGRGRGAAMVVVGATGARVAQGVCRRATAHGGCGGQVMLTRLSRRLAPPPPRPGGHASHGSGPSPLTNGGRNGWRAGVTRPRGSAAVATAERIRQHEADAAGARRPPRRAQRAATPRGPAATSDDPPMWAAPGGAAREARQAPHCRSPAASLLQAGPELAVEGRPRDVRSDPRDGSCAARARVIRSSCGGRCLGRRSSGRRGRPGERRGG